MSPLLSLIVVLLLVAICVLLLFQILMWRKGRRFERMAFVPLPTPKNGKSHTTHFTPSQGVRHLNQ